MTRPTPSPESLAAVEVCDDCGGAVRLDTLWADRDAVIVWVRHFG